MRNLPLRQIAALLGVSLDGDVQVLGYQIDSRKVREGDLFFALKGEQTDGHFYLEQVKEQGAVAAVVAREYAGPDHGLLLLRVEDVLFSLQELARLLMADRQVQVIGITGSVGKTTTKDFLATLLSQTYKVGKPLRSFNTKVTFPLTLLNLQGDEEILVLEMGMSEPGDIARLNAILAPDIGVLTKIAPAHVEFFPGGLEEIAYYKAEIFADARTKIGVFDQDFTHFEKAQERLQDKKKVSFSLTDRSADYFLSEQEGKFLIDEKGVRAFCFDPPFKQTHILHNLLAAIAVCRLLKMPWEVIEKGMNDLQLPQMRFEQFEKEGILFVNDAYNANPASMRAALQHFPQPKEGGKRIAVLGSMKELGPLSEEAHQEMGRYAQKVVDHLLTFGPEAVGLSEAFQEVKKPAEHFQDPKILVQRLKDLMSPGDVVLVKGSRSLKMEQIFTLLNEE